MHSDIRPFAAAQADTLPGTPPTVSTDDEGCSIGHSAAYLSHRRADTAAMWRAARSWISLAYPAGLDVARAELVAKFPDLAANVARLEQAAHGNRGRLRARPGCVGTGVLDGLAALDNVRSRALCIDCGAEVATVKTGLGQRVCSRRLRAALQK